jgi:methyl-accepting chemotaxis protein
MKSDAGIHHTSFRAKLTVAFMATIIPIVLLGIISAEKSAGAIKTTAANASIQTMEQTNRYLELLLWNVENTTLQIAGNSSFPELTEDLAASGASVEKEIGGLINEIKRNSTFISDILVITESGRAITTSGYSVDHIKPDVLKKSNFYKKAARVNGGTAWLGSHPELDAFSKGKDGSYSLFAARLMRGKSSGDPGTLILVDIKQEYIKSLLENVKLGDGGEVHLISPDSRDFAVVQGNGGQASGKAQLTGMAFFRKVKNGSALNGSDYITYLDKNYLMTYSRLGTTGFLLLGLIPDSVLYSASRSIALATFLLVGAAVAVSVALGLSIAFHMGKVIRGVALSADQAAKGDLTVAIPVTRRDEFGVLAHSLSKMISDMRQLIGEASSFTNRVLLSAGVVSDNSRDVSSVSNEILQVVQQIADGANHQSSGTEEASFRIIGLSSRVKEVSDSAGKIERLSNRSLELAESGAASIRRLSDECGMTADVTGAMISDIHLLEDYSKDIGKLVKAIRTIAEQTDLLALNAAIEAAHAGNAGSGFSVVAEEIRKLADMSVSSVRETENIIRLVSGQIHDTARKAASAEAMARVQKEALSDTITAFASVSSAMSDLNAEVHDIRAKAADMEKCKEDAIRAIGEISEISQETAASTQELAASVENQDMRIRQLVGYAGDLNEASAKLSESLGRFRT